MLTLKDILSKEEIEDYKEQWAIFRHRVTSPRNHEIEKNYKVHSGMPVISKVFRYKDKLIFRSHIFQNRLRKFDPYFIAEEYIHPAWHSTHYLIVAEQMYHASAHLIRDNELMIGTDVPDEFKWKIPIFWNDKGTSVELILEDMGKHGKYEKERANFTFYNKKNKAISRMSAYVFLQPRAYISTIERLKQGDEKALESLIKKIESQSIKQNKLIKPRKKLQITTEYLINELLKENIPEEDLRDFFSFWDKQ